MKYLAQSVLVMLSNVSGTNARLLRILLNTISTLFNTHDSHILCSVAKKTFRVHHRTGVEIPQAKIAET